MVSPFLAAGIGAGLGGLASGLGAIGTQGTGQAGKLAERQAGLAKKVLNTAQFQLPNVQSAARTAAARASQFPSTVVPFSPQTTDAFGILTRAAAQPTGASAVRDLALNTASGQFLDPATNPFLAGTIEAATRPTLERLGETALPGLQSAAIAGGAYGGNRGDLVGQALTRDATREALDIANTIAFQNYAQERDRQLQAGNLFTQASALDVLPAQFLGAVGEAKEGKAREGRLEQRERFDARTAKIAGRPLAGLDQLMALAAGAPSVPITNISPSPGQQISGMLQGAIGGGLTGLSLSPTLSSLFATVPQIQPPTRFANPTTGVGGAGFSYPYYGGPR